MPFAAIGAIGAAVSVAGAIKGMTDGPGGSSAYIPTNQAGADTAAQNAITGLGNNATTGAGLANNIINNPYAGSVIPGAQRTGSYLTGSLAPQLRQDATRLSNSSTIGLNSAQNELNTAFDPQNALYNRTLQQTQDQTLAGLSATGVGNSPYGAGVLGQTLGNFNIDWQNNQLARQQSGLSSYGQYLGQAGNGYAGAGNLGNASANAYLTGSSLPYSTYNGMQTAGLGALGTSSGLYGNQSTAAGNYLNIGQGGQQAAFNQSQIQGQNLGTGLQSLSGYGSQIFGGNSYLPTPSGATSNYQGLQYQSTMPSYDPSQYQVGSFG